MLRNRLRVGPLTDLRHGLDDSCAERAPERRQALPKGEKKTEQHRQPVLQASRLADAPMLSHNQAEIKASSVDQQTLEDIGMMPKVSSAHASGLKGVSKATFDQLSALTHQTLTPTVTHPATIGIHRLFC